MRQQSFKRLLIVAVCAIALFMASFLSMPPAENPICQEDELPAQNTTGPQLLWETLSRQFLSSVHY
jgi:hypothetical protein